MFLFLTLGPLAMRECSLVISCGIEGTMDKQRDEVFTSDPFECLLGRHD